jgi:hypothetical protein
MNRLNTMNPPNAASTSVSAFEWEQARTRLEKKRIFLILAGWDSYLRRPITDSDIEDELRKRG